MNKEFIVKESEECGRFVLSGEKITKNEAIYREKAFAFIPVYNGDDNLSDSYHCQNCALVNCFPFPCYDCSRASYCSPKCREEHQTIHQYDCAGYKMNLLRQIGIAQLALRCLLVGLPPALAKLQHRKGLTARGFLAEISTISDFSYKDVCNLVSNFDKMDKQDCVRYGLTGTMLSVYLAERTTFMTDMRRQRKEMFKSEDEWKKLVTVLLVKHMGQLVCNGHAISDVELVRPIEHRSYILGKSRIALTHINRCMAATRAFTAIFPTVSLLNHSCDPNIYNKFDGMYLTIYAARDIAKNEQIYNCYGPHFKQMYGSARRDVLKQQYHFECKCSRCVADKKAPFESVDVFYRYICSICGHSILMDPVDCQWWNRITNDEYIKGFKEDFQCVRCQNQLALNPFSFREFLIQGSDYANDSKPELLDKMLSYYFLASHCLSEHHEIKQKMAQIILSQEITGELYGHH